MTLKIHNQINSDRFCKLDRIYNHLILNNLPPSNFGNHQNNKFIFIPGKNKFILRWGCWAGTLSGLVNNVTFTNDLTYENFD